MGHAAAPIYQLLVTFHPPPINITSLAWVKLTVVGIYTAMVSNLRRRNFRVSTRLPITEDSQHTSLTRAGHWRRPVAHIIHLHRCYALRQIAVISPHLLFPLTCGICHQNCHLVSCRIMVCESSIFQRLETRIVSLLNTCCLSYFR